ncbi:MAG: hypothetical protein U1E97_03365 [Alphaproteobacteria bacterium]
MSYKKENTGPKLVSSALSWLATASVASFAAFITVPAQATIVATDLAATAPTNPGCGGPGLPCDYTVGSRTMAVDALKDLPSSELGAITFHATRGLGVLDPPDGVRVGRNSLDQEALRFAVSGTPVTITKIVIFDADDVGTGDDGVSMALYIDGLLEAVLSGNGSNSLVTFDLTGLTATTDFVGSTFVVAATVNPEAGFHVQAVEFNLPAVVIDPPPVDLPLPATLGLLGIGLASVGLALRRPNRFGTTGCR